MSTTEHPQTQPRPPASWDQAEPEAAPSCSIAEDGGCREDESESARRDGEAMAPERPPRTCGCR